MFLLWEAEVSTKGWGKLEKAANDCARAIVKEVAEKLEERRDEREELKKNKARE